MLLDCFGHLREQKSQEQRTCCDYNLSPHWKYWCSLWWCFDHASSAGSKPGGDEWSHCYCTQSRQDVGDFRPIQYSDSVQGRLPQSNPMQAACIALIPIRIKDQGSRHDLNCHAGMSLQLIYHVVSFLCDLATRSCSVAIHPFIQRRKSILLVSKFPSSRSAAWPIRIQHSVLTWCPLVKLHAMARPKKMLS